jgi:hypothetical protein
MDELLDVVDDIEEREVDDCMSILFSIIKDRFNISTCIVGI